MNDANERTLGVIGGSGLYDLPGLEQREGHDLETPFGRPSDVIVTGRLAGVRCAFLPRHGRGHRLMPSELPFRANIHAMKQLGMECVLGISAVGSMREDITPGDLVLVDQFIDRTRGRTEESTFFGDGCVGHVQLRRSGVRSRSRQLALAAARDCGRTAHDGGTYLCIEGPAFSTRAESRLYRSWGVDVIGMTNLPRRPSWPARPRCAYATIALATDYDCWHETAGDVNVAAVVAVLQANVERAKQVVARVAARLAELDERITCEGVMEHALLTAKDAISADARRRLQLIIGRYA